MTAKEKKLIGISLLISIFLIGISFFYRIGSTSQKNSKTVEIEEDLKKVPKEKAGKIGKTGSAHEHFAFVLSVNGKTFDFNQNEFAEQSKKVHFHDGNGWIVHKHATGITLPYFLNTLGMTLTEDCLILKDKNRYCEKGNKKITVISEGKVVENWMNYVLDHGDKVLLDYSSSTLSKVKFRYNNIPDIPWKYLKSVEEIKEQK